MTKTENANLTVKEMAEYLRIGIANAYKLVREPDFPAVKILGERKYIIPRTKLDEWLEQRIGKEN